MRAILSQYTTTWIVCDPSLNIWTCYSIYIPVPEYFHIGFPHWSTHKFRLHDVGQDLGEVKWSWVMQVQGQILTPLKIWYFVQHELLVFVSAYWDFWCHDAWPHWRSLVLGSLVLKEHWKLRKDVSKLSYVSLVLWLCMNYPSYLGSQVPNLKDTGDIESLIFYEKIQYGSTKYSLALFSVPPSSIKSGVFAQEWSIQKMYLIASGFFNTGKYGPKPKTKSLHKLKTLCKWKQNLPRQECPSSFS